MTGASGVSDAALVAGVLAGDRDAFAQVYEKYVDRLHDFAYSMLRPVSYTHLTLPTKRIV